MQIQNQTNQALNMYKQNTDASSKTSKQEAAKNDSLEEIINNSAYNGEFEQCFQKYLNTFDKNIF